MQTFTSAIGVLLVVYRNENKLGFYRMYALHIHLITNRKMEIRAGHTNRNGTDIVIYLSTPPVSASMSVVWSPERSSFDKIAFKLFTSLNGMS